MTYAEAIAEFNETPFKGELITRNAKLTKGEEFGIMNAGLELAPHKMSGYNTCRWATGGDGKKKGCADVCVMKTQGFQVMPTAKRAKIGRTKLFFEHREVFAARLKKNVLKWQRKAKKAGLELHLRLNAASDVDWERIRLYGDKTFFEEFPDQRCYDYTKGFDRMVKWIKGEMPENYHLTFSRSGENDFECREVLSLGGAVAVVFADQLPDTFWGYPVIDGDETDARYLDGFGSERRGLIVGLIEKGKKGASRDGTGFVVYPEDLDAINDFTPLEVIQ